MGGRTIPYSQMPEERRARERRSALIYYHLAMSDPVKKARLAEVARNRHRKLRQNPMYTEIQKQRVRKCLYGITADQYNKLLSSQGSVCAICKIPGKKLVIDHDHSTGAIRGLLCNRCNMAIAFIDNGNAEWILECFRYSQKAVDIAASL